MNWLLQQRQGDLQEWMDIGGADQIKLFQTYRFFSVINRFFSGWSKLYESYILPLADENQPIEILDIGFGGGDIPLKIYNWAKQDGIRVKITGIETDPRALTYVDSKTWPDEITFEYLTTHELIADGKTFDVVISNHLLHHLTDPELKVMLEDAGKLSDNLVLFNDLERNPMAFTAFSVFIAPFCPGSYIAYDGRISIRKSYRKGELQAVVPAGWKVKRMKPWRLLLIRKKNERSEQEQADMPNSRFGNKGIGK
ncbi:MAG TPA: methyltransferase domain-containing protein [Balneolales bacterium]|nr:methyltransferase domain-containing protein [Balneolales bacterium]